MEGGGAPLYETLEFSFPRGIMPAGLEHSLKRRLRKKLRALGYRLEFPSGDPWEAIVETFSIAGLEGIHRSYGNNPWFWVVAWPGVFGAAASDFWPGVGSAIERRAVATTAAAAHLESILASTALDQPDVRAALPEPAILGLRAIGQSTLPALPSLTFGIDLATSLSLVSSSPPRPTGRLNKSVSTPVVARTELESPYHSPQNEQAVGLLAAPTPAPGSPPLHTSPPPEKPSPAAKPANMPTSVIGLVAVGVSASAASELAPCCKLCDGSLVCFFSGPYDNNQQALCDECFEPVGLAEAKFWHCRRCKYDLCKDCAV